MMNSPDFIPTLIEDWQRDFPLTAKPFALLANKLDVSENMVLESLQQMQEEGSADKSWSCG